MNFALNYIETIGELEKVLLSQFMSDDKELYVNFFKNNEGESIRTFEQDKEIVAMILRNKKGEILYYEKKNNPFKTKTDHPPVSKIAEWDF